MVVAYQQAVSKPTNKPKVTSYETYKKTNDLQNNWFKSAPSAQRVLVSGGSVPNVSYNENWSIGEWVATSNSGHTWYKSPEVNHGALSQMRINFTTTVDEQYVTFYLKAYSEENYDFVLISEIDSEKISKSDYTERASGNGVEVRARLKCNKAGAHFVCVAYAKDSSGVANGDYGLVRMATNENYVYADTLLYRCDGDVNDGVISWGSIYQAQGDKGDKGDQGDKGDKGDKGEKGDKGALIRQHKGFESGQYTYYSGADNEDYLDVVYFGEKWYQCKRTYTPSSTPTSLDLTYWKEMNNFQSIATSLLLAKNAAIDMLGSSEINLTSGSMYGSFRVVDSNDKWSLWLGASTGDSAPFGVTRGGAIKSTSGTIGGVEISQDKLGVGVADIGNHTFTGAILSRGGLFTGYKSSYFGAGVFADYDPSDSKIQMYDKNGTTPKDVSSPSLYVRKYTGDDSIINNIDKDYGAALIVDVPRGVGVASLGNNVLGGLALSAVAGNKDIGSTNDIFQKNRGTVAYFTNSSACSFYLPASPHEGQVVIVIQGSTGKITFFHPSKNLVIQNTTKKSGEFYSGSQGQFNIFVYIGSMWYGTYSNG